MSPAEIALLFTVVGNSITIIVAAIKVVSSTTKARTITEQKIKQLEEQVNNDVTGRRVVGEMRQDIATIKAQIDDMRGDIKRLHNGGS